MFEELNFTEKELLEYEKSLQIRQRDLDIEKSFIRVLKKNFQK